MRLIGLPIKEEPDDTDNLITELFDMDFNKRNDWLDLIDKAKKMYNSNVLEWAFKKYETLRFEEDRKKRLLPKEDAEEDIEGTWRATNYQFHYNQLEQTLREARIALGVYTEVLVDSQTREEDMKKRKTRLTKSRRYFHGLDNSHSDLHRVGGRCALARDRPLQNPISPPRRSLGRVNK